MKRLLLLLCAGIIFFGAGAFLLINPAQGDDTITTETIHVTAPASSPTPQTTIDVEAGVAVAQLPPSEPETSNCLDCHSNVELLQQVAEEEVVQESLSEGSG